MQIVAEKAGLRVERVKTITSSEWLHYQWIHLFLFPNMQETSVFWLPSGKFGLGAKIVLKALATIHRTRINHLITRLFDALGMGDNHIFFLRKK